MLWMDRSSLQSHILSMQSPDTEANKSGLEGDQVQLYTQYWCSRKVRSDVLRSGCHSLMVSSHDPDMNRSCQTR